MVVSYNSMMKRRLSLVKDNINVGYSGEISPKDLIKKLFVSSTITYNYDIRNLRIDLWYLRNKGNYCMSPLIRKCNENFYDSLWMAMIVIAIADARGGRPCDFGVWRCDVPPGYQEPCTKSTHYCAQNALTFLFYVCHQTERGFGMPEGTIKEFVYQDTIRKNRSQNIGLASISGCR